MGNPTFRDKSNESQCFFFSKMASGLPDKNYTRAITKGD